MSVDDALVNDFRQLRAWLVDHAFPLWWNHGMDRDRGGCHESLTLEGLPTDRPCRARVHPRQICAFGAARSLSWEGPSDDAILLALDYFTAHFVRSDGLIRSLVDTQGHPLEEAATLEDQAIAMRGFLAAAAALGEQRWVDAAITLRNEVLAAYEQPIGFAHRLDRSPPYLASALTRLLDTCLVGYEIEAKGWYDIGSRIVELAVDRLLHPRTHVITECFDKDWTPQASELGLRVLPGRVFTWGYLLLRWAVKFNDAALEREAVQLIDAADRTVHAQREVAMNELALHGEMLIVRDASARLWVQAERVKASILAARVTRDPRYTASAVKALQTLRRYLDAPILGLWRDTLNADGSFANIPASASSLWYLVEAALECERYVRTRREGLVGCWQTGELARDAPR